MGLAIPVFLLRKRLDVKKETQIAKGGFGDVYLGSPMTPELKEYGEHLVVKTITGKIDEQMYSQFLQEVSIMHYLQKYENIAKICGYLDDPPTIIMKYYPLGDLFSWTKKLNPRCQGI